MEVTLLGTGGADGWPNAFCACPGCTAQRSAGILRSPTSALVDDVLLLDCGPETPRQALRAGRDLTRVETILITHAHTDHVDPAFLLYRSWVSETPLRVIGPGPVIAQCRTWVDPAQTVVSFTEVTAGDRLGAGGYEVLVIPANHRAFGEAVLYGVRGPGAAILYATDTGAWADGALELIRDARYDLVLLEESFGNTAGLTSGHHRLDTFGVAIDQLRTVGGLAEEAQVVAVHLTHHNPPEPELTDALARLGARPGTDGERIRLG